jgi:SAM-dependent methyltransferase
MSTQVQSENPNTKPQKKSLSDEMFSRIDDTDDGIFYATDRFVSHIDSLALSTVEDLIGSLVVEQNPVILDLMAGWDSHIPGPLRTSKVVGLGLNSNELAKNRTLSQRVLHDLNRNPTLPFEDQTFDAVINTVSVDYMTKPLEVFREVARILRPGGLFLVIFSNRMFEQKAVKIWRDSTEAERPLLVEELFERSGHFEATKSFVSKGRPRPKDDKYSGLGLASDPVYAVYADRKGGNPNRKPRPVIMFDSRKPIDPEELARRTRTIKDTLRCPYCGERLLRWLVPDNPFTVWQNDFMYICFNDACPYLVRGWSVMNEQGNPGASYRLMYNPERDVCMPVPVPSLHALKDGIAP